MKRDTDQNTCKSIWMMRDRGEGSGKFLSKNSPVTHDGI